MDLREKRRMEMAKEKKKRKEEVVKASIDVLCKIGIENTKMTDIAEAAEVGVASLYRYFKTKPELVVAAAEYFWHQKVDVLYKDIVNKSFEKLNGCDRISRILNIFMMLFKEHKDFIRFLEEFDNYVVKEKISPRRLTSYEKIITDLKSVMFDALKLGKSDGTIRSDIDDDIFYITVTHSLMTLCQKLTLRGTILKSDSEIKGEEQIEFLIKMAVSYIKTKS